MTTSPQGPAAKSCGKFATVASAHLDRQLTPRAAADYRTHLATRAACRAYLADLRRLSRMLKTVRRPVAPPGLHHDIMSVIAAE